MAAESRKHIREPGLAAAFRKAERSSQRLRRILLGLVKGQPAKIFLLLSAVLPCFGQVTVTAVTDAAAYGPRLAPGALATIFGTNLGTQARAKTTPLPTMLGGTTVAVGGISAPLLYVSAGQINFQVPSGLQSGANSVVVTSSIGTSGAFKVTVLAQAPAIFQYGVNRAVAQDADAAHSLNSSTKPAASGSVITVYLTGQGAVDNAVKDGDATPVSPLSTATATVTATIGPQNAPIKFLGLTPGFAGLAQANIQVPALPNGDYPLVITVGGTVSTSAIISVSGSGTPFTSPLVLAGTVNFANSRVSDIALLGNVAYVCGTNRITMVDVSTPGSPSLIGEFGDGDLNGAGTVCKINSAVNPPYLVDIVGPLSSPVGFAVYDLSFPASPNRLGVTLTQYPYIVDLSFSGPYGFATTSYFTYNLSDFSIIAQNGDFLAFNFTTPAQPLFGGIVQPSALQPGSSNLTLKPAAAVINSSFAYVATSTATGASTAGTGALNIIDINAPFAPFALGQIAVPPAAVLFSFDVSGNTLLASGNTTGNRNPGNPDFDFTGNLTLTTMDVSTVQSPVVLASFDTGLQVNGTFNTAAFTNGVFAITNNPPATDNGGPSSLSVVDARQPSSPILYPLATQFGFSGLLPTSGGYLLAPTSFGLSVYQLQLK
jgi:uncharacterized protein (TIGR03437 family)